MLSVADESVFERIEKIEAENLLPRKVVHNVCAIYRYTSHKLSLPKDAR